MPTPGWSGSAAYERQMGHMDNTAEISNTRTSKGIVVRLERIMPGAAGATATAPWSDGP